MFRNGFLLSVSSVLLLGSGLATGACQEKDSINYLRYHFSADQRKPMGFGASPYPLSSLPRYVLNYLTNGYFSYKNEDMRLASKEGSMHIRSYREPNKQFLRMIFLGDIMTSKSGKGPHVDDALRKLLCSADVIVANVESPVVQEIKARRGLSLQFAMHVDYLKSMYDINPQAVWVFSMANNHACDTCSKEEDDVSGLEQTVKIIKEVMPNAIVIGACVQDCEPGLSFKVNNGPSIGILAWTDLMNNDHAHHKKPVTRGQDISMNGLYHFKKDNELDFLIGFAHGNEEQSCMPCPSTRSAWRQLFSPFHFDLIIGTGPHVAQPIEEIDGRLLFHSIGNFCSPVGRSQTKVGYIPEFEFLSDREGVWKCSYHTHIIQQKDDEISLVQPDYSNALYPDIVGRIQSWFAKISAQSASPLKKAVGIGCAALAGYLVYRLFSNGNFGAPPI